MGSQNRIILGEITTTHFPTVASVEMIAFVVELRPEMTPRRAVLQASRIDGTVPLSKAAEDESEELDDDED